MDMISLVYFLADSAVMRLQKTVLNWDTYIVYFRCLIVDMFMFPQGFHDYTANFRADQIGFKSAKEAYPQQPTSTTLLPKQSKIKTSNPIHFSIPRSCCAVYLSSYKTSLDIFFR